MTDKIGDRYNTLAMAEQAEDSLRWILANPVHCLSPGAAQLLLAGAEVLLARAETGRRKILSWEGFAAFCDGLDTAIDAKWGPWS